MRQLGLPQADTVLMTGIHIIAVAAILTHGIEPAASLRHFLGIGERPSHLPALSPDPLAVQHARLAAVEAERAELAVERNVLTARLDRCAEQVASREAGAGGTREGREIAADLRDQLIVAISARDEAEAERARLEGERAAGWARLDAVVASAGASRATCEGELATLKSDNKELMEDREILKRSLASLRETVASQGVSPPQPLACMDQATEGRSRQAGADVVVEGVVRGQNGLSHASCACDEDGSAAWADAEAARNAALRACGLSVALLLSLAVVFGCLLRARRRLRSQAEELSSLERRLRMRPQVLNAMAPAVAQHTGPLATAPPHAASHALASGGQSKVTRAPSAPAAPLGSVPNLDGRPARVTAAVKSVCVGAASPVHLAGADWGVKSHLVGSGAWPSAEGNGDEGVASPWPCDPLPTKQHSVPDEPHRSSGAGFGSPAPRNLFSSPPAATGLTWSLPTDRPASIPPCAGMGLAATGEARTLATPASAEMAGEAHGCGTAVDTGAQPSPDRQQAQPAAMSPRLPSSRRHPPPFRSPLFLDEFGPFC